MIRRSLHARTGAEAYISMARCVSMDECARRMAKYVRLCWRVCACGAWGDAPGTAGLAGALPPLTMERTSEKRTDAGIGETIGVVWTGVAWLQRLSLCSRVACEATGSGRGSS